MNADEIEGSCPLCDDHNWTELEDSVYLPRASISQPVGFGVHVLGFECGTCGYILLIRRPANT